MKTKLKSFIVFSISALLISPFLVACVDGVYDPEGRWELNCQEPDSCEENDTFETAYEASAIDLLYLNFYDDIVDFFIWSFNEGTTYTLKADVPSNFGHLSSTLIQVIDTGHTVLARSSAPDDDDLDAVIENFSVSASGNYYVLVSGDSTGELRGYNLFIEEDEEETAE